MSPAADEHYSDTEDEGAHRVKRRKGPKACDVCRRKKIRCDPDPSGDSQLPCVNCALFKTECTHTYIAKKRRTQQAYIDGLHDRLHKLENLVSSLAPDIDLSKDLDDTPGASSRFSHIQPACPLRSTKSPPGLSRVPVTFSDWREPNRSEDDDDEDFTFIPIPNRNKSVQHRFMGKSSGLMLLEKIMDMKRTYTGASRSYEDRKEFALLDEAWEEDFQDELISSMTTFNFPSPDLLDHLIDLFFCYVNSYLPLLHRPSFEADVRSGLHKRDQMFAAVLLSLCAVASRWSDDPRVLSKVHPETERNETWYSAGWDFYSDVYLRQRKNHMHATSVRDLQLLALGCIYLYGSANPSPPWQIAGLGVRLAFDVGAHLRKRPDAGDLLESELWKRAFWVLVVLDRMQSVALGRPCAIWEEDIDTDLPLEVDDEYMTEKADFKQPADTPSQVAFFNSFVKLTNILIGALRTIYPINKSKSKLRVSKPNWEQDMVAALDSSLNSWIENIPEHLRWDPKNPTTSSLTLTQSGMLQCYHAYVQIVVHRTYITKPPSSPSSSLAFPSLAICTTAARSCAHVLDVLRRRTPVLLPSMNHPAFASALVLLFNIWGVHKKAGRPGVPRVGTRGDWHTQVGDVHVCMRYIGMTEQRWHIAKRMLTLLRELVSVGDFPLPQASSLSPPNHGQGQGQQRRDLDVVTPETRPNTPTTSSGPDPSTPYVPPEGMRGAYAATAGSGYDGTQGYYQPNDSRTHLASVPVQVQDPTPLMEAPQNMYSFMMVQQPPTPPGTGTASTHVLSTLDHTYLAAGGAGLGAGGCGTGVSGVGAGAALGNGVVMDMAQQTLDIWGNAVTAGFTWDNSTQM